MKLNIPLVLEDTDLNNAKFAYQSEADAGLVDAEAVTFEQWIENLVLGRFNLERMAFAKQARERIMASADIDTLISDRIGVWTKPVKVIDPNPIGIGNVPKEP